MPSTKQQSGRQARAFSDLSAAKARATAAAKALIAVIERDEPASVLALVAKDSATASAELRAAAFRIL